MLFDTHATQTAQASLDALWKKAQVITNNLANADTPNFKEKSVSFAEVLDREYDRSALSTEQRQQLSQQDQMMSNQRQQVHPDGASTLGPVYRTTISTQTESSVRVDGNNVQLEQQQAELWKTYAQYSYLLDRLSGYYGNISTAIANMKG